MRVSYWWQRTQSCGRQTTGSDINEPLLTVYHRAMRASLLAGLAGVPPVVIGIFSLMVMKPGCHGTTREQPLKRFADTEKALLQPLPDVAPELAVWAMVSVHGDAHVQF
ncbi:MAG: hypothetical protein U1A22_04075, partial [Xanthomonadaceae bacterium]|nr:hypothetical protein [Xanthomonadaceae bacterium]